MPGFVFVCGVPRSGTTLFAELLNLHPKVVVGIERFKNLALKQPTKTQFTADVFHKDRFFDVRPEDTNIAWPYDPDKYANAAWVGDKVPRYYRLTRTIFDRFPGAHMFYVCRAVDAVARSWKQRAQDPSDSWPERNDHLRAVKEWNIGNRIALQQLHERPGRFHVVAYEDICSGSSSTIAASFAKLGLSPPRTMEEVGLQRAERHARLSEEELMQIEQTAKFAVCDKLLQHRL